jgi:radical SAM superfamily enzyme
LDPDEKALTSFVNRRTIGFGRWNPGSGRIRRPGIPAAHPATDRREHRINPCNHTDDGARGSDPRISAGEGGVAASPRAFDRFRTLAHLQRVKHGDRVFRIDVGTPPENDAGIERTSLPAFNAASRVTTCESTRDELIRGMSRLNDRHGATRFHACLRLPPAGVSGETVIRQVRESVALAPVVGVIVKAAPEQVTPEFLTALRIAAGEREAWLELDLTSPESTACPQWTRSATREAWARATHAARDRAVPVIASVRLGVDRENDIGRSALVDLLNHLRVRSVRFRPVTRPDADTDPGSGGQDASNRRSKLSPDHYVEMLADIVERLDSSILIQGLGSLDLVEHGEIGQEPKSGPDLHLQLEERLQSRGARQGSRRHEPGDAP